LDSEI